MAIVEYCCAPSGATAERPIRIFLNGSLVAISQGSPYGLSELAVGYLLSEGFIAARESLLSVEADESISSVYVCTDEPVPAVKAPLKRVTSAGCSSSAVWNEQGESSLSCPQSVSLGTFDADALLSCMDELCALSPRRNTGECVHGCGLAAPGASMLALIREDIGRHNAMDKLIGRAWLDRIPVEGKALFITGRISTEMALKAHRCGAAVLVSRKSATDEAVWRAQQLGVTLASHCREGRVRVLSCPDRIV